MIDTQVFIGAVTASVAIFLFLLGIILRLMWGTFARQLRDEVTAAVDQRITAAEEVVLTDLHRIEEKFETEQSRIEDRIVARQVAWPFRIIKAIFNVDEFRF